MTRGRRAKFSRSKKSFFGEVFRARIRDNGTIWKVRGNSFVAINNIPVFEENLFEIKSDRGSIVSEIEKKRSIFSRMLLRRKNKGKSIMIVDVAELIQNNRHGIPTCTKMIKEFFSKRRKSST